MNQEWSRYNPQPFHDELMVACQESRPHSSKLVNYLASLSRENFCHRVEESERVIREMGITFTIYSDAGNIDRAWPFDIIPRAISGSEWIRTETGLKQRIRALNMFIQDVYSERRAIRDGVIPEEVVMQSKGYREACVGMTPPHGVWANICGSDLVRHNDGVMYVLEDNLRVPSGVAYMLENRRITKRVLPEIFNLLPISPVSPYPEQLYNMLASLRPDLEQPTIALLTPGIYNSAYFEHAYLAQQAGLVLLEGADLMVGKDNYVYMKTIQGPERVDVIYRRIDDDFIDPEVFRKDSMLGVPGIMRAWREGKVAIANAPGCGVADDKVIYAYVPDMIRYFLGEEPSLPNVPTWVCRKPEERAYVLEHLPELVVKPANESGGYGMLVGPHSTPEKVEEFRTLIQENPNNYIAQPTLS
ncbi:MAG: circularly permuted type 2 ATP-grasp protein, partial [Thiothrix sp.]